jgi:hypothetical protein
VRESLAGEGREPRADPVAGRRFVTPLARSRRVRRARGLVLRARSMVLLARGGAARDLGLPRMVESPG